MASTTTSRPATLVNEVSVDDAWDRLLDTTLRRAVYGAAAGGAAALVLLRAFFDGANGGVGRREKEGAPHAMRLIFKQTESGPVGPLGEREVRAPTGRRKRKSE